MDATIGGDTSFFTTIDARIDAKRDIIDSYSKSYLDLQLSKNIIDSYTKSEIDTLINNPKSTLFTSYLRFLDVEQAGISNFTIQGGITTKIEDYLKNVLMEFDVADIKIHNHYNVYLR